MVLSDLMLGRSQVLWRVMRTHCSYPTYYPWYMQICSTGVFSYQWVSTPLQVWKDKKSWITSLLLNRPLTPAPWPGCERCVISRWWRQRRRSLLGWGWSSEGGVTSLINSRTTPTSGLNALWKSHPQHTHVYRILTLTVSHPQSFIC